MRSHFLSAAVALGLVLQPLTSAAATFCVDTTAELQSALQTAAGNAEDDVIRIKTGAYAAPSGTVAFAYATSESFDLLVEGGWATVGMVDCGRKGSDPAATLLSGSNARQVMAVTSSSGTDGAITLEGFGVVNGFTAAIGGGIRVGGLDGYAGNVTIDRVLFLDNLTGSFGGGLSAGTSGILVLRNSLFIGNEGGSGDGGASLTITAVDQTNYRAFVGNNTFVANDGGTGSTGGLRIGTTARNVVFNNAFAFNTGNDVTLSLVVSDLFNNNLVTLQGTPAAASGNLALADPLFVNPLADNYRLQTVSPLRNAGTGGFDVGDVDFAGRPRLNDGQYDIGAYENDDVLLRDGFELVL